MGSTERHAETKSPREPDAQRRAISLSPELRDFLVSALADILVLDYEQSQRLIDPTVAEGSLPNRGKAGQIVPFPPMGPKS